MIEAKGENDEEGPVSVRSRMASILPSARSGRPMRCPEIYQRFSDQEMERHFKEWTMNHNLSDPF